MGQPKYITQAERDRYADPNVLKIADNNLDTLQEILRILDAGFAKWNIQSIFPHLASTIRVTNEHPFDLLIREEADVIPSVSVHWTSDPMIIDTMGRNARSEQITVESINGIQSKRVLDKITSEQTLNEIKSYIQNNPEKVYGYEEDFYFNEVIEVEIWDNNVNVRNLLYKIAKGILLSEMTTLYAKGAQLQSMQGTPGGLSNAEFGIGLIYGANITMTFRNAYWTIKMNKGGEPVEIKNVIHGWPDIHTDDKYPEFYEELGMQDRVEVRKI